MKLVCDCGNEEDFCEFNKDTKEKNSYSSGEGLYTSIEKFTFWETHDVIGIICEKCGKDIWLFT